MVMSSLSFLKIYVFYRSQRGREGRTEGFYKTRWRFVWTGPEEAVAFTGRRERTLQGSPPRPPPL